MHIYTYTFIIIFRTNNEVKEERRKVIPKCETSKKKTGW